MLSRSGASWLLAFVYAASVVLHVRALAFQAGFPLLATDEAQYVAVGENLRLGRGFTVRGEFHSGLPPLYPAFVAAAHSTGSDPRMSALIWSCAVMSLALFPAYRLARSIGLDRVLAGLAATATVVLPNTVFAGLYMTETLSYPLFFATLFAMAHWLERPGVARAVIAGALLSLMSLTKVATLSFAGAVLLSVLVLSMTSLRWSPRIRRPGASAMIVLALVALAQFAWQAFKARHAAAGLGMYARAIGEDALPHFTLSIFAAYVADFLLAAGLLMAVPAVVFLWRTFRQRPALVVLLSSTLLLQVASHGILDVGLNGLVQERLYMYSAPVIVMIGLAGIPMVTTSGRVTRTALLAVPLALLCVISLYPFTYIPVIDIPWAAALGTTGLLDVVNFNKTRALLVAAAITVVTGTIVLTLRGRQVQVLLALFVIVFNTSVFVATAKKMSMLSTIARNEVMPIVQWLRSNGINPNDKLIVTGDVAFFQDSHLVTPSDTGFIAWQRQFLPVITELQIETVLRLDLRLAASPSEVDRLMMPGDRLLTASRMTGLRLVSDRSPLYLYQRDPGSNGSILPNPAP